MTATDRTPLTPEREAEIRTAELLATKGPWVMYSDGTGRFDIAADLEDTGHGYRCRRGICQLDTEPIDNDPAHQNWTADEDNEQVRADAEFIIMARPAVPALLAEVERLRAHVAKLEQQAAAATEYRVPAPGGPALYVRRSPAGTGWAVFEPRGNRGRRAWTRDGWQLLAILADSELHCWPDATTALAEARKALAAEAGGSR